MDNIDVNVEPSKTTKMSSRKRPRSPHTNNNKNEIIEAPPNKKQKTTSSKRSLNKSSSKKSTKSKPKLKSKKTPKKKSIKNSNDIFSESKDEEKTEIDLTHFLSNYQTKIKTIIRIRDVERFEEDMDDDEDDEDDINKSRKLKFTLLINNRKKKNNVYINLSEIFRAFKYSSSSMPNLSQARKSFIEYCLKYSQPKDLLYTKFNKKYYISEPGFCVLIESLANNNKRNNQYVEHFCYFRYFYRKCLFLNDLKDMRRIKKPRPIEDINICKGCCLDDVAENFCINPCDCQCLLHINCKLFPQLTRDDIPEKKDCNKNDWFCPYCTRYLSIDKLKERRGDVINDGDDGGDGDGGSYEVEKVIDYDFNEGEYLVKWKNYPPEANEWTQFDSTFVELVEQFWKQSKRKIPDKARQEMENKKMDIGKKLSELDIDVNDDEEEEEQEEEEDDDVDMKCDDDDDNKNNKNENKLFIETKLNKIMDEDFIIRRQKYTSDTYKKRKEVISKYKKWLQKQVIDGTKIGIEVKHEMRGNLLPKWHLRSINKDWDCGLPRIRDIIISFLSRNWKEWKYDLSHKSMVIGEIIDPENPAKKYGGDQGVHENKAYGLFAKNLIKKDELLFEYAGCVKPIGIASKKLDNLENELAQTTLFDLIGHLDTKNRNKLHWGKKPNEQLVIDPSKFHNEGVYMNDYRDNVMDDPDDDIERNDDDDDDDVEVDNQSIDNNNNNNIDKARKQNVKFYEVLVNNWPRVFAVAICDIKPNEELLGDYGTDFWANFRLMMQRQKQLNDIKNRINKEWQLKLDDAQKVIQQQKNEIEQLKKQLQGN